MSGERYTESILNGSTQINGADETESIMRDRGLNESRFGKNQPKIKVIDFLNFKLANKQQKSKQNKAQLPKLMRKISVINPNYQ